MKIKNRKFKIRNGIRKANRERHQKNIATNLRKFGGGLSFGWFMFCVKLTEKIAKKIKASQNKKKPNKPSKVIEARIKKAEISGGK